MASERERESNELITMDWMAVYTRSKKGEDKKGESFNGELRCCFVCVVAHSFLFRRKPEVSIFGLFDKDMRCGDPQLEV